MLQFPPPPDVPIHPSAPWFQLLTCLVLVLIWFELVLMLLPERWRRKICQLQFGPRWAGRNRDSRGHIKTLGG